MYPAMVSSAAAVVIAKKRRHIINAFRSAGAVTPEAAKSLVELGLHDSRLLQIQVRRRVLVEAAPGRYYLDVEREEQTAQTRRNIAIIAILVIIIMFAVAGYFTGK